MSDIISGGNGENGKVSVLGRDGAPLAELLALDREAAIGVGDINRPGRISLFGADRAERIRLDAATGAATVGILNITGGRDLAEPFDVEEITTIEPGTVMVIDDGHPGRLKISDTPYDRRVAGVVSGACGLRPGLTLQQAEDSAGEKLVALAGRVYCKAEARSHPIEPGDLLTTSDTPGYSMRAPDPDRSHGAILGKAMTSLRDGTGYVLVLVNLH